MNTYLYQTFESYLPEHSESRIEDSVTLESLIKYYKDIIIQNEERCVIDECEIRSFLYSFFNTIAPLGPIDQHLFFQDSPKIKPISEFGYYFILSYSRIVDNKILAY